MRLPAKQQETSPCIGEPKLALPRRLAHIRDDASTHPTPGAVTIRLLVQTHIAPSPHLLLQDASSRGRNPPIPPGNGGFSEVGACPLAQNRRLPRPFLAGLDGSGSGCLGRGGLTRGVHDPILSETSLIRPTAPHAVLFPVIHQGKSLGKGVHRSSPQGSHRTGSSDSRLLQSPIRGPEGLRVLATHHRPIYPEHVHSVATLPYGDSSVRPTLHSPRRLDDLTGPSGRLASSSIPPGITSVSSLHYGRSPVPVQGTMLRANNCPSGLYKAHGPNIRHSPSLRYQWQYRNQ